MAKLKALAVIILASIFISSCSNSPENSKEQARAIKPVEINQRLHKIDITSVPARSIIIDGDVSDWQRAEIAPIEGLKWKNIYNMPMFKDSLRIKSVRLAYDAESLLLLLKIDPGVRERFEKEQSSGHIAYLYLDADGNVDTGSRRHINDKYRGWDFRIYLPEGFLGKIDAGPEELKPAIWYQIEKIKEYQEQKTDRGITFNCEYEEIAKGNKPSFGDPNYIAFRDSFVEMRFPFSLLQVEPPRNIRLIIDDLDALPNAETQILGCLKPKLEKLPSEFSVSYYFSSEVMYRKIEIDRLQLTYTYFDDSEGKCDKWMVQSPCWGRDDLKIRKAALSEKEAANLLNLIEVVNFMNLDTTYGNAQASQRYYPHKISVKLGDDEKRVFYQSFPEASPMPEEFKKIKSALFKLIRDKFNLI